MEVLGVPPVDLANGTATIQLKRNGHPLRNKEVGVSYVICPPGPTTAVLIRKDCKLECTDCEGKIDLCFKKGAQNEVRISVNIDVGEGEKCCARLSECITPNIDMQITPLNFMALDDDWEELKLFLAITRNNEFASRTSEVDHTLPAPQQGGPCRASRALAIAQIAMSDAFNSIKNRYARYTNIGNFFSGDARAAIAQANHDVLAVLFSLQTAAVDAALASFLEDVPDGSAKNTGIQVGKTAAQLILALRANDNSNLPNGVAPSTNTTTNPGKWSQAPPESNAGGSVALGSQWGIVTPFTFQTSQIPTLFRAPQPPAVTSLAYVAAFNDQKALGAVGDATRPTTRTNDQTEAGIYWGYDGTRELCAPPSLYYAITRHVLTQEEVNYADTMRVLTLVGVSMAEAGITAWDSKYFYNYWRPITAIRYTGAGVNPAAVPQSDWLCLGAPASNVSNGGKNFTPPFPSYVSGHATFGGALFETLRLYFQTDEIAFSFCSSELDGKTTSNSNEVRPFRPRSFVRLSQAEQENGESRLFLGIHWYFDRDEGIVQGNKVANWVWEHAFQPV